MTEKIIFYAVTTIFTLFIGLITYIFKDLKNDIKEIKNFIQNAIKDLTQHKEKFAVIQEEAERTETRLNDHGKRIKELELNVKDMQTKHKIHYPGE